MKQLITRLIDAMMPPGLDKSEQSEDVGKARVLIFLFLLIFACALLGALGLLAASDSIYVANTKAPAILGRAVLGYGFGLLLFRRTGWKVVCSNILALTYYATIVESLLPTTGDVLIASSFYLLFLPFLVALTANYWVGMFWVAMVAIAPLIWNKFGAAHFGIYFLGNWVVTSCVLFGAIHLSFGYLNRLAHEFNTQRSWLEFVAGHDSLTGAANRATFDRRLMDSISLCKLRDTKSVLVYIDLDKFKPINDTHGHQAGDIVLTTVADRLRRLVRSSDLVARLGGDEFAILFDQCRPDGVRPVIDRIATVISEPIEAFGKQLNVGSSMGVVICPDDGIDPKQLAHTADERMYESKKKKNNVKAIA